MKLRHNKNKTARLRAAEPGLTRVDLLAVIGVLMLMACGLARGHFGESGRIARCARNLQVLGGGMQDFANDHNGALPPAGMEQPVTAWNMEITPYLQPGPPAAQSPGAMKELGTTVKSITPIFACPSDPIKRSQPRSYAMSAHDMRPENWPPGPDNETGLGLVWSKASVSRLLGDSTARLPAKDQMAALALVKTAWIPDPANTLLLTELYHADNQLGRWGQVVTRAQDQVAAVGGDAAAGHRGCFNYLMLDGHVELLSPLQTGSWRGDRGIWTIRGGD